MTNGFAAESRAARRMAGHFPVWSQIRKDPNSLGRRFIGGYGSSIDDGQRLLDEMLASLFLETLDENQITEVDAAVLPKSAALNRPFTLYVGDIRPAIISRLKDFYAATSPSAYIEHETRSVYLKNAPGNIAFSQDGKIVWLDRFKHPIWNDFDEFGLLLGLPRIPGESNSDYRTRMMTVGQVPPGASEGRLIADWSRRLGLIIETVWEDDRVPLEVENALPFACFVDGRLYPASDTGTGALLSPVPESEGQSRSVIALSRITSAPFWDRDSRPWLATRLYDPWGEGTHEYRAIVQDIAQRAPLLWGEIKADEAFWEAGKAVEGGIGCIPSRMDPDLSAWRPT